ncbi:hypothetical protein WJX81_002642 [Elliptochloris bilobata]|uniref:Uncharacterized protein n=1 Tax=Elliptochloris bilobata TaxID=381761 RepID=A0AAW1S7D1_9CHLO
MSSSVRLPRKHKGEVLSQSSEQAKVVRRQARRQAGIKGRREFDTQAERRRQNPLEALFEFVTSPLPLEVRYGMMTTFHNIGEGFKGLFRALQQPFVDLDVPPVVQDLGTIVYTTFARNQYGFDLYAVSLEAAADGRAECFSEEERLTDGTSINFNGAFSRYGAEVTFVSERDGNLELYQQTLSSQSGRTGDEAISEKHKSAPKRLTYAVSLQDRPVPLADGCLLFVSTQMPSQRPRQSWAAVYHFNATTGRALRMTPRSEADFSPAISPDGKWLAVATGSGQTGLSDVAVMRASDGLQRRTVATNGGWPAFGSDGRLFFHRVAPDGWWSIYAVDWQTAGAEEERITPPGMDVMTPAAAPGAPWLAVATRSGKDSGFRHIALLRRNASEWVMTPVTRRDVHHYNPFVADGGRRIGYHRCRSHGDVPTLERHDSPLPGLDLLRLDGSFPSFAPDGNSLSYISLPGMSGVSAVGLDGAHPRLLAKVTAFSTSTTERHGRREVAAAAGGGFSPEAADISIIHMSEPRAAAAAPEDPAGLGSGSRVGDGEADVAALTRPGTGNNAFPSYGPDGSEIVFRSARSGYKNLYLMDARGEEYGLTRLTEGPWTDNMPEYSPDGGYITFMSSRDNATGAASAANMDLGYDLFLMRPDGTGLRKLFDSHGGVSAHPHFSPDSQRIVFTSDHAGYSAEQVSTPFEFQPYGDLFVINLDGSGLQRLTHDLFENGTPAWGAVRAPKHLAEHGSTRMQCDFGDTNPHLASGAPLQVGPAEAVKSRSQGCPFLRRQAAPRASEDA